MSQGEPSDFFSGWPPPPLNYSALQIAAASASLHSSLSSAQLDHHDLHGFSLPALVWKVLLGSWSDHHVCF